MLVAKETEEIFNDRFWSSLNLVINAVDNNKARIYIDGKCVWHEIPLFDSGTTGTKASS
jgi:ubiquitin-activating enzyme E1